MQTVSLPLLFLLSLQSENLNGWDHPSKSWDNIKTDLKVVYWIYLCHWPRAGSCDYNIKPSYFITSEHFLDQTSDCHLLKDNYVPWIQCCSLSLRGLSRILRRHKGVGSTVMAIIFKGRTSSRRGSLTRKSNLGNSEYEVKHTSLCSPLHAADLTLVQHRILKTNIGAICLLYEVHLFVDTGSR
jgi:hypothetical protein